MVPGQDGILTHLRRGALEYCILAMLEVEDRYGFDIARNLDPLLLSSEGTLYPLLARLRKAGWVQTNWQESATGPPRRYYQLTSSGRETLHEFRIAWKAFSAAVDNQIFGAPNE